ncbi:glycosyltransferase family protein [Anditalea andensis]|uniref:Glycosyltransferase subfamily 4-like N-terminal domain-containing protein n=1 Tax=Anditalea andensis TaxID=1048983 RepID=A0A074LI38_9BACT|nr:hypothetical protein [Anditalea andensis]KEO73457.1 hypothetical protein EL17_11150 [Anditalea andensis]
MKKNIIISFYFEPCTLTPSQRITYWAKNFHKLGYYPTIITREWKADIKSHFDTKKAIGHKVRHERHEHFEVFYLPFHPGILDRAYYHWGETALRPLFFLVKLIDVILAGITLRFTSYSNFFPFLTQLCMNEKYNHLIVSGEPFYLFKIGYYAHKLFKLKWIADYRDDWSTNELQRKKGNGFLRKLIFNIESFYEKRWVSTADHIISVSPQYTNRISNFLNVPGITIENGFEESLLAFSRPPLFDNFTIVYSGTVYPSQNIEIILDTLKVSKDRGKPFQLVFLGSGFDIKEKKRIEGLIHPSIQQYVKVTERLTRADAIKFLLKAHAVLGISYGNLKGIPSSKLYEYIGLKKPVLLCPTDNDIMEIILSEVNLGFFATDKESCFQEIERIRSLYIDATIEDLEESAVNKITKYSRFIQMAKIKDVV